MQALFLSWSGGRYVFDSVQSTMRIPLHYLFPLLPIVSPDCHMFVHCVCISVSVFFRYAYFIWTQWDWFVCSSCCIYLHKWYRGDSGSICSMFGCYVFMLGFNVWCLLLICWCFSCGGFCGLFCANFHSMFGLDEGVDCLGWLSFHGCLFKE